MALNGIDVSNHNHPIDPTTVPGDFVIMRASEGQGMRDPHFAEYDRKVRDSPKLAGAYHFMWVGTEGRIRNTAKAEAANFAAAVESSLRPGFLLVADWEPAGSLSMQTGWAVDFAHEVKRLTGRFPLLYANRGTLDRGQWGTWRAEISPEYWLAGGTAQYAQRVDGYAPGPRGRNPHGFGDPALWQFTEHGYLPGWGNRLDLNVFYGDADRWRAMAGDLPAVPVTKTPEIPAIRENDAPVHLFHHHGGQLFTSRGQPRLGCTCMKLTLPLIERRMLELGLIRHQIDVFQAGYNRGGVAASAGTHDMGGVIDVAQGITREQRGVWADFGVMMFPRTRQYGWTTGDHGHGVWHGCVHRSASAARQVRDGINGRDGLVSNTVRNFVAPTRTWQDAYRETLTITLPETIAPQQEEDVPDFVRYATTFQHGGITNAADPDTGWELPAKDQGVIVAPRGKAMHISSRALIHVPEGVHLRTRWVSWSGRENPGWVRGAARRHESNEAETVWTARQAWPGADLRLDIWCDQPCTVRIEATAEIWELEN